MRTVRAHPSLSENLSILPPLTLADNATTMKLELKPYLQPFERHLALRELTALAGPKDLIEEKHGFWTVITKKPEALFREQLTYWQRVGRDVLTPTDQTLLELSQNGTHELATADARLHRARRLRYGPHGVHEYRGKFFPQLVRSLITISEAPLGATVFDPMCGSGTAPAEALAFNRSAIGIDLNPLSVLISRVKCSLVSIEAADFEERVTKALREPKGARARAASLWSPDDLVYMQRWFSPEAIADIAHILSKIRGVKDAEIQDFLLVCLSNVLRSVSWQKAADLRVRKEIRPYERGEAKSRFEAAVQEQVERIHPYLSLLSPRNDPAVVDVIRDGNSINADDVFPEYAGKVDVLITSPPYATALPYLDTDRLSLIVLGLLPRQEHRSRETLMIGTREVTEGHRQREWARFLARQSELPQEVSDLILGISDHYHSDQVGFRRRNLPALLGKYYLDMLDAMKSARRMMRKGASGFYVVGNNSTTVDGDRVEIPTDEFLFKIGSNAGWQPVEAIDMELLPSRDIFRDNRGSKESILWLRA